MVVCASACHPSRASLGAATVALLAISAILVAPAALGQSGTWTPLGPGGANVTAVAVPGPIVGQTLFAGTASSGVLRSFDGGATWALANDGLSDLRITALAARVVPPPFPLGCPLPCGYGFVVYAATQGGGVFKGYAGSGATWISANNGLTDPIVASLALDAVGNLYAGTASGVFKSADGGGSWARLPLLGSNVRALAIDLSNPLVIYAGAQEGISKSVDGGTSWTRLQTTVLFFLQSVSAIAIDPNASSTVYAAGIIGCHLCGAPARPGVMRSLDGGATWTDATNGLGAPQVNAFAVTSDSMTYAGTQISGVFQSTDSASSWAPVNAGLTTLSVLSLLTDGSRLFAGTAGGGVFRAEFVGTCVPGPTVICLNRGRFRVEVSWSASNLGQAGAGQAVPMTSDTGAFWLFQPSNIELVLKVLDGRAVNGHFWAFYGALTNVGYTITVTDTVTGAVRTYTNPEGQMASRADTEAF